MLWHQLLGVMLIGNRGMKARNDAHNIGVDGATALNFNKY